MTTHNSTMNLLALVGLLTFINFPNNGQNLRSKADKIITHSFNRDTTNFEKTEVICDTVFRNKNYKFTLTLFDTVNNFPDQANTIFTFEKLVNGQYKTIFLDTIYCERQEIQFEKFTTNNIKSILVKNNADIRSNWTYYLYRVNTSSDKLKKVKGFEEIKNPNYIAKYDLIDNYVMSGRNWTSFYKIQADTIKHFDIVVYDNQKELDGHTYKNGYGKAIKKITVKKKNNSQH
jgi:hypothetical protein